jgi:putative nucleotidyltransferase with HDIG domain
MFFGYSIHDIPFSSRLDFEQSLLFDLLCSSDHAAMYTGTGCDHILADPIPTELFALAMRQDAVTFAHGMRVGMHAREMAKALGMSKEEENHFTMACCLHDIGKVLLPNELLAKKLPLEADEMALIREHPVLGAELLTSVLGSRAPELLTIVRSHHERWDGTGYPDGLYGTAIPKWARMCAVLDSYDAMTRQRSYNRVKTDAQARDELWRQRGRQFDSYFVELFLNMSPSSITTT